MQNKVKPVICIVSGKNPLSARSGYAAYAYNLAKTITKLGYTVKIFCVGPTDDVIESEVGAIYIVGSRLASILKDVEMAGLLFLAPLLSFALIKHLKDASDILVWGIGPWSLAGALLKFVSWRKRSFLFLADYFTTLKHEFLGTMSAIKVTDHGLLFKVRSILTYLTVIQLYTLLEWFLLKSSNKIITHYKSTEDILKTQFGLNSEKFIRFPLLVELVKRNTPSDSKVFIPSKPLILTVCRHDGRKGINFLLHAFDILNKRGLRYSTIIIGAGPLREMHLRLAQKLNLKNVYQTGFVADIKPYLKRADLFVFPSVEEGSSALAILEAMKEGLPIVSTNVDGIPEDLQDGKSALLVPPKDPQELALAIKRLLENPKKAKKLGHEAKKRYYQKYKFEIVKKEIARFLNGL